MVLRNFLLALGTVVLPLCPLGALAEGRLPPEECVRKLRLARIVGMRGWRSEQERMLSEAVRACPDQAVVRLALQDYYRTRADSDVPETVRELLATQGLEFSLPLIARSVQDLQTSREQLSLFEEPLRHWLEEHPDDANGLRLAARLWLRLERPEDARRALQHLLSVQPSPQVRHYCILLDVMLERWADALELMKPQLEVDDSAWLRLQMARALSEIGQYEAMMEVVTPLLSKPGFSWELVFLIPAGWALWANSDTEFSRTRNQSTNRIVRRDNIKASATHTK